MGYAMAYGLWAMGLLTKEGLRRMHNRPAPAAGVVWLVRVGAGIDVGGGPAGGPSRHGE